MRSDSRGHRLVAAALVVAMTTAWTNAAWADCKNDSECKGDRVCEKGVCVSPPAAAAPPTPTAPPPVTPAPVAPKPAEPAPFVVDVTITNGDGDPVTLEGAHARETCRAPCSMQVPPGRYFLKTKGFTEEIDIPSRASEVTIKRGCAACYIGGAAAMGAGLTLAIAGAAVQGSVNVDCVLGTTRVTSPTGDCPASTTKVESDEATTATVLLATGIALLVTGGIAVISGVAIGSSYATVNGEKSSASRSPASPPASRFGLVGRGVGFTF